MIDVPDADEYVDFDRYGLGVPFSMAVLGLALVAFSFPGITGFTGETVYGKIGVIVLLCVAIPLLIGAGYTYRAVDTDEWMLTKADDGPNSPDGTEDE